MDDAHVLLARALACLTVEEQGEVLKALLPAGATGLSAHAPAMALAARAGLGAAAGFATGTPLAAHLGTPAAPGAEGRAGLLVRLPAQTHRRLKDWSDANGHSMNVVVRGLVEHFLDAQGPRATDGAPA